MEYEDEGETLLFHRILCQDSRKSGLRALMIYPLNALVDDQMRRLRFVGLEECTNFTISIFRTPRFAR